MSIHFREGSIICEFILALYMEFSKGANGKKRQEEKGKSITPFMKALRKEQKKGKDVSV